MVQTLARCFSVILFGLLLPAIAACGGPSAPVATPPPGTIVDDPAAYEALVSQFDAGVAALDVEDPSGRALRSFTRVTELAPDEPAGWANLAIVHLGVGGDVAAARQAIDRALTLAPDEGAVAFVDALVTEREGRAEAAVAALRRAVAADPGNLRARYRLVQSLERQTDGGGDAVRSELEAIVAAAPENRLARLDLARLLAKSGDAAAATAELPPLWTGAERWSPRLAEQRAEVQAAAESGDAAALGTALTILGNLLVEDPAFLRDAGELRTSVNPGEHPLRHFLRVPELAPDVAEPDLALAFAVEPIAVEPAGVGSPDGSPIVDAGARWATAAYLSGEAGPTVIVGVDGGVRLLDIEAGAPPEAGDSARSAGRRNVDLAYPSGDPPLGPEGVLVADLDNDRRPDVLLAGPRGVRLYRQTAAGVFEDATAAIAAAPPMTTVGEGGLRGGTPARADTSSQDGTVWSGSTIRDGFFGGAWALDVDLDGDLDVVLGTSEGRPPVLRNNGDGTWAIVTPFDLDGLDRLVWADFDADGDNDVVAQRAGEDLVWLDNERGGVYIARPIPDTDAVLDFAAVDLDDSAAERSRDGVLDLLVVERVGGGVQLRGLFRESSTDGTPKTESGWAAGLGTWPREALDLRPTAALRLLAADIDNNGLVDQIVAGPNGASIALAAGGDAFAPIGARVTAVVDLDGDGRLDLVGTDGEGRPVLATNRGGSKAYHWQRIRPRGLELPAPPSGGAQAEAGSGDQRINSFGIGGQVSLRAGRQTETVPIAGPVVHLGLGLKSTVDVAYIQWPNGVAQAEFDLPADGETIASQRLKGSCPWLFADDGTGQQFVTDILWRSPLGLRINAVDTAGVVQTRDWVNLGPDQLRPVDGRYALAITAELWETHFFDEVKLLVVDHPADIEPLVDERFSIPPPPLALQPLTVAWPIASARDDAGRDVTDLVRARDGRYLDTFALGDYQGLARDHWVELDLGPTLDAMATEGIEGGDGKGADDVGGLEDLGARSDRPDGSLVLLAQGWIYPTDSSINVAIGQGQAAAPSPLVIEIPDGASGWRTAGAPLGFPAGKHKSMLIDLDGLDPDGGPAPRRLRLRTNLEIYWDHLALAARVPDASLRITELAPDRADLAYRGFSVTSHFGTADPAPRRRPEIPLYDRIAARRPQWIDLGGYYTRFGDVRDLLAHTDDRTVILNAGDEIRLSFPVPPGPPAGWTRRFVFISDGWEKDGDLNTAYGGTVLPLPSHDQPQYADPAVRGPVGDLTDDPVYRRFPEDWRTYHTRYVSQQRWPNPLYR